MHTYESSLTQLRVCILSHVFISTAKMSVILNNFLYVGEFCYTGKLLDIKAFQKSAYFIPMKSKK
jgi:hypothetical protein